MKFSNMSLKWQLIMLCLIIVIIPILALGFFSYNFAKDATFEGVESRLNSELFYVNQIILNSVELTQKKVSSDLNVVHDFFYSNGFPYISENKVNLLVENQLTGEKRSIVFSEMVDGNGDKIYLNYDIPDKVKSLVGGTSTIFQIIDEGALRISTNVLKDDGSRAIETFIPRSSEVYKTIEKGETYYGKAYVVNDWYLTAYEPIRDADGKIIGILYVGIKDVSRDIIQRLSEKK